MRDTDKATFKATLIALDDFVSGVRRVGPERVRDLIAQHEDELADGLGQDMPPDAGVLLGLLSTALDILQGWQEDGADRVVLTANLDRGESALFQCRGDAPRAAEYLRMMHRAVDSIAGAAE